MKKYIAEFIGTFALVFCGTGAVIVNQHTGGSLGLIGIAATFGIIITAIIYVFGSISGAHLNPAVTISLALGKLMPKRDVFGYILSQLIGALLASSCLYLLFPNDSSLGTTLPNGSIAQSFCIEFLLTCFLMLTILSITSKKEHAHLSGIVIGLMVTGIILFAGPVSGGSFNPARSIGPSLISGNLTSLWIYIVAPTCGAVLGLLIWKNIKNNDA